MTPKDRQEIEQFLAEFRLLDPEKRKKILQEIVVERPGLCENLNLLLQAVGDSLTSPAPTDDKLGSNIRHIADSVLEERVIAPKLGRYSLRKQIASGGFGTVYLAFDEELRRSVAIKVPRADSVLDVDAYLNEARTAARLRHPGIVPVYDAGRQADGTPYVVMMYVEGPCLEQLIRSGRPTPARTAKLLCQVAEAVHHAHTQGFVHRDLKPSNILLDEGGRPYVADFGLALHEGLQHQHKGDASGTPLYRAPEQVRGEADWLDGRCDIWALGVILYEMLTGRHPFFGVDLNAQILNREPKPPRMIDGRTPEHLERICLRCLAKSPENRYLTAGDLAKDLGRLIKELTPASRVMSFREDERGNAVINAGYNVTVFQPAGRIQEEPEAVQSAHELGPNPYKGLAAFHEHDAHLFFGREKQVERLWEIFRTLHEEGTQEKTRIRLLPILGPSGCGKSSLSRAGLIAELSRRALPGAAETRVLVFTPGSHPLESLAIMLARVATADPVPAAKAREFSEEFKRANDDGSYDGLRRVASLLPMIDSSPLVLLVDQFEEVYSLCDSPSERNAFIENLLHAASDKGRHVSVVITLRSDFLGETQEHQRLNSLIAERGFIVPAMTEDELRRAIAEPARQSGHAFDDSLVDLLIKDSHGREGALPLLQFALSSIWKGLTQGVEPLQTLKSVGGVGGALAQEAQRIYDSLDVQEQTISRRIFLTLIQLGEGTRDTRRRASLKAVISHRDDPLHVRAVLARYCTPGARLITLSSERDGTETAEITHEALFDHWQTLKSWLATSREDLRFHRRLDEAAYHWHEEGRPEGILWRSPDLDLLREFHKRADSDFTPVQLEFFLSADRQELEEKKKERRRVRFYKSAATIFGMLLVLIAYLGFTARQKEMEAQESAEAAREAHAEGRKRLFASQMVIARHDLKEGRVIGIRELLDSHLPDEREEDLRGWEWYFLQNLLHRELRTLYGHASAVLSVDWSPSGSLIASGGDDHTVRIWDAASSREKLTLRGHTGAVRGVTWSPDSALVASGAAGGTVAIWDVSQGLMQVSLDAHQGDVRAVSWSPRGDLFASGGDDRRVKVWHSPTVCQVCVLPVENPVRCISWSHDGKLLAASHGSPSSGSVKLTIWETASWMRRAAIRSGVEESYCVAWSPDDSTLAFGGELRHLKTLDIAQAQVTGNFLGHKDEALSVVWDPIASKRRFASASADQTITLWDCDSTKNVSRLCGHEGAIYSIDWSPDGLELVSGSGDGLIKIWDPNREDDASRIKVFPNWVNSVSWHSNSRWLATAYLHPSTLPPGVDPKTCATIWDTETGKTVKELKGHTDRVWKVVWSPDGERLATASTDRTVKIWSASGEVLRTLGPHETIATGVWWSPDGKSLASYAGNVITFWDSETGMERFRLRGSGDDQSTVAWSPDGTSMAIPTDLGHIDLCEAATGKKFDSIEVPHGYTFAWSPSGKWLAIGALEELHLWDFERKRWVFRSRRHHSVVNTIAWSPDNLRLVTGSRDGAVKLHDARTGFELITLHETPDVIRTVAWSPDGKKIAAGSWGENTVHIWDASKGYAVTDVDVSLHIAGYDQARSLVASGKYSKAAALADHMVAVGGDSPNVLLNAARIYAESTAETSKENQPTDVYVQRAIRAIDRIIAAEPAYALTIERDVSLQMMAKHPEFKTYLSELNFQPPANLVPAGSIWKYLDHGPYPSEEWENRGFDDSKWLAGAAPLGYGDGDEATVVSFGEDASNKRVTTHFRHSFQITDAGAASTLVLGLVYDDGAAVYLNGQEILRKNLKEAASAEDLAIKSADEKTESSFFYFHLIDPKLLADGENVLAVEMHQDKRTSSDISFDLSLATEPIQQFVRRLNDKRPSCRIGILRRLAGFGNRATPALLSIVKALADECIPVRSEAARTLGQICQLPEVVVPELVKALGDESADVRHWSLCALNQYALRSPETVRSLEALLISGDPHLRAVACRVLGTSGAVPKSTSEAIRKLTGDESYDVRHWATAALLQIDPEWAEQNLSLARTDDPQVERHRSLVLRVLSGESLSALRKETPTPTEVAYALRCARAAKTLAPESGLAMSTFGRALYYSGEFKQAVAALERSEELLKQESQPTSELNIELLSLAYETLGQAAEARRYSEELGILRVLRDKGIGIVRLSSIGASAQLGRSGSIEVLNLTGSALGEEDLGQRVLPILQRLPDIRELNLSRTRVDDAFLSGLSKLLQVQNLGLHGAEISNEGLQYLLGMTRMRLLNLSHTNIDGAAVEALGGFESLEFLALSHTQITDAWFDYLSKLEKLMWLDLESTDTSDAGLSHLKGLKSLRHLRLGGTRVSTEGVQLLQRELPGLKVYLDERLLRNVSSDSTQWSASSAHCLDEVHFPRLLSEDAEPFVDRHHQYNGVDGSGIPEILRGAEYIRNADGQRSLPDFRLDFDLARGADIYLLLDDRVGDGNPNDPPRIGKETMGWVISMGFVDTGLDIGLDEYSRTQEQGIGPGKSIDNKASIFVLKDAAPGHFTLREQNYPSANMYGVAVVPKD